MVNTENKTKGYLKEKTIIIAEDEEVNSLFLYEVLKETGASIVQFTNGKEVINYIKSNNKVDLILMDIKMPIMNGFDAVKEILKMNLNIPIIAQTAYAMYEEKIKALNAGFTDYITKPIDPDILLETVERVFADNM